MAQVLLPGQPIASRRTLFQPPVVVAAAGYADEVLADSPALYWRLGEASGTTAADTSGNGRTGTYSGVILGEPGAVAGDTAISLDAVDDRVKSDAALNIGTGSVEVWVYATAFPASDAAFCSFSDNDDSSVSDKYIYITSAGKARFELYDGAVKRTSVPTPTVPLDQWVHLVATFDATTARLYQNGGEVGTVAAGAAYTGYGSSRFNLGYNTSDAIRIAGKRDEAAVYSTALSADRVLAHYEAAT